MKRRFSRMLSVFMVFAMVFTAAAAAIPVKAKPVEASLLAESTETQFQARIKIKHASDLDRLQEWEIVILEQGDDYAVVSVDEGQLEKLAQYRFEPMDVTMIPIGGPSGANEFGQVYSSKDDDNDGLTNTMESWWCTDPLNPDTDGDGATDLAEVEAARDWLANRRNTPPSTGKPFLGWPSGIEGCADDDGDSVPDMAERWDLGLNMNKASTDGDKYDDGLELFGNNENNEQSLLTGWVDPPGNSPFVAAYPVIEINVMPSTIEIELVSEITTGESHSEGETIVYETANTEGISMGVGKEETHSVNRWQEVGNSVADGVEMSTYESSMTSNTIEVGREYTEGSSHSVEHSQTREYQRTDFSEIVLSAEHKTTNTVSAEVEAKVGLTGPSVGVSAGVEHKEETTLGAEYTASTEIKQTAGESWATNNSTMNQTSNSASAGHTVSYESGNSYAVSRVVEHSTVNGVGYESANSTTITREEYKDVTVTNGNQFGTEEEWSSATSVNTAHAADLRFQYLVENIGTDKAAEITNILYNIQIGSETNPITVFASALEGTSCSQISIQNLYPGQSFPDTQPATQCAIPLTLEQLKLIDLGQPIRISVVDYNYGVDNDFYENAWGQGVIVEIDDGTADGDETVDRYLIPTWGEETYQDVLKRYFPLEEHINGNIKNLTVPEYTSTHEIDSWVEAPVSTHSWWNIYPMTENTDEGVLPFRDLPAIPESRLFLRYNVDTDGDYYSDRLEGSVGTDGTDPDDHPLADVVAGYYEERIDSTVTVQLALQNFGNYNAFGTEAYIYAPDDSITIESGLVGMAGRIQPGEEILLSSKMIEENDDWNGVRITSSGHYSGSENKTYTFWVNKSGQVGQTTELLLNWSDGLGNSGSVAVGSTYLSPTPLAIADGIELSLETGTVFSEDSFVIKAVAPFDVFEYTINREPYTKPVIVISYNTADGNKKFTTPIQLNSIQDELLPFSGDMNDAPELEIITTNEFYAQGDNTVYLEFLNPLETEITDGYLFIYYAVSETGEILAERKIPINFKSGPNIYVDTINASELEGYDEGTYYKIRAYATDYSEHIISIANQHFFQFGKGISPELTLSELSWDAGVLMQGELAQYNLALSNTGEVDMQTYINSLSTDLEISDTNIRRIQPGGILESLISINTAQMSTGPFDEIIEIRTNDINNPVIEFHVTGTVEVNLDGISAFQNDPFKPDAESLFINGPRTADEVMGYESALNHTQTIPIMMFDENYVQQATAVDLVGVNSFTVDPERDASFDFAASNDFSEINSNPSSVYFRLYYDNDSDADDDCSYCGWTIKITFCGGTTSQHGALDSYGNNGWNGPFTNKTIYSHGCVANPAESNYQNWYNGIVHANFNQTYYFRTLIYSGNFNSTYFTENARWHQCVITSSNKMTCSEVPLPVPTLNSISNSDYNGSYQVRWSSTRTDNYELEQSYNDGSWTEVYEGSAEYRDFSGKAPGKYEYRVRSKNIQGTSSFSSIKTVYVNVAPNTPTLSSPANGATISDLTQTFTWTDRGDPDNLPTSSRKFQIEVIGGSWTYTSSLFSGTSTIVTLPTNGSYSWRVRAYDGMAYSSWSSSWTVGVADEPPNPPINLTPTDGTAVFGREVRLQWEDGGDPDNYPNDYREFIVTIWNTDLEFDLISEYSTDTFLDVDLPGEGIYTWKVMATDGNDPSEWTPTQTIRVYSLQNGTGNIVEVINPYEYTDNESFSVQYGQSYTFSAAGTQTASIEIPYRLYQQALLEVYTLEIGGTATTFDVDFGGDNLLPWSYTISDWQGPTISYSEDLTADLNTYLAGITATGGELVEVPLDVSLNTGGKVLVTNIQLIPGADSDPYVESIDIKFSNESPKETDEVDIIANIHNGGIYTARNVIVSFYQGDPETGGTFLTSAYISEIPSGDMVEAVGTWNTTGYAGVFDIYAIIDPSDQIKEMDETNNSAFSSLTIRTLEDLMVTSVNALDVEPVSGETISISVAVENLGESVSDQFTLSLYDGPVFDGILIDSAQLSLNGGESEILTFNWTATTLGEHRLFVKVDTENIIIEASESNNVNWQNIYVGYSNGVQINSGFSSQDPEYPSNMDYGFIDDGLPDLLIGTGTEIEDTYRKDPTGQVIYEFDHLLPEHSYHLDIYLKELDGAGRLQNIKVDDMVLTPELIDLGDGELHMVSYRLDPAVYADHSIRVEITAEGIDGAIVNGVYLWDIDYRYADAGNPETDLEYTSQNGYGWLDSTSNALTVWGTLPYQSLRVDQGDNILRYQFDNLLPGKTYQLHLTFWEASGVGRTQRVEIDGIDSGESISTADLQKHSLTIPIPANTYLDDQSIVLNVIRQGALTGALVNEVTLEEKTLPDVTNPLSADFDADTNIGAAPLTVTFTNQSSGQYTSSQWDFGDGETSSEENPQHVYDSDGTYSVGLLISDGTHISEEIKTNYIVVSSPDCFTLTSNINPEGAGIINIETLPNCENTKYYEGTEVTLEVLANAGYTFSNWSGDSFGEDARITMAMDSDKSITAEFVLPVIESPEVRFPKNGYVITTGTSLFKWTTTDGAVGYEMELFTPSGILFDVFTFDNNICDDTLCQFKLPYKLEQEFGSWDWRTRGVNNGVVGDWSNFATFDYVQVDRLTPSSPVNNAMVTISTPTLTWLDSTQNIYVYMVEIWSLDGTQITNQSLPRHTVCSDGICTWTTNTSLPDGTYTWRIMGKKWPNMGEWINSEIFTISSSGNGTAWNGIEFGDALDAPTPKYPKNNYQITAGTSILKWATVTGASAYVIELYRPDGDWFDVWEVDTDHCTAIDCTYKIPYKLAYEFGSWTWRVRAKDADLLGSWSANAVFDYGRLNSVETYTPLDETLLSTNTPTFTWEESSQGIYKYVIEIWSADNTCVINQAFSAGVICNDGTCTWTSTVPLPAGEYRWRVMGKKWPNTTEWTPMKKFEINIP